MFLSTTKNLINGIKNFNSSDSQIRFGLLRRFGTLIFPRYRFRWPQIEWWNNKSFTAYLDRFDESRGMNSDRRWMLYQLLRLVENIPGDTAECGVYKGADSYLICKVNESRASDDRMHLIFDSFEGVSTPTSVDESYWNKGDLSCAEDVVKRNLAEFKNLSLHKGWIPDEFPAVGDRQFSFVHIDVDLYQPTLDSVEFFYPRMNDGGIVVCDDYGFTTCPGATKAIDEFLEDKIEKMISLSSGGGFFVKGCNTGKEVYT